MPAGCIFAVGIYISGNLCAYVESIGFKRSCKNKEKKSTFPILRKCRLFLWLPV